MRQGRRVLLAAVIAVSLMMTPSASAQLPCSFAGGFAAWATFLGPDRIGFCIEDEHTLTDATRYEIDGTRMTIESGITVQLTTKGLLTWSPGPTQGSFLTRDGAWVATSQEIKYQTWAEQGAVNTSSPPALVPTSTPLPTPKPAPLSVPVPPVIPAPALPLAPPSTNRTEAVWLVKAFDSVGEVLIERRSGNRYILELGVGCLAVQFFEGKRVIIDSPGIFAGTGSMLILPDERGSCRIWSRQDLP